MKCIKCGSETPYSATSSLCSSCGPRRQKKRSQRTSVVGILILSGLIGMMCVFGLIDHFSGSKAAVQNKPSQVTWSGTGPDCTPNGHPNPQRPGVNISDLYSDDCPTPVDQKAKAEDPLLDPATLIQKFKVDAESACEVGADDYLRVTAKYDFKWDDTGFLGSKFQGIAVTGPYRLRVWTKKLSLQNGFGAYERVRFECEFDAKQGKVIEYSVHP